MRAELKKEVASFIQTVEQIEGMCRALLSLSADADKMHPSWMATLAEGPVDTIRQLCDDLDTFICKHVPNVEGLVTSRPE